MLEAKQQEATASACPVQGFWKRLGVLAFLFFLVKGLAWLALPFLLVLFF